LSLALKGLHLLFPQPTTYRRASISFLHPLLHCS